MKWITRKMVFIFLFDEMCDVGKLIKDSSRPLNERYGMGKALEILGLLR